MFKDRQLQRYRRKDYSEIVEFPVEIVGRDGIVRRYDFEESIRLYQRRMSFASTRFLDEDLVDAELGHCRARIEQLRRSFFHLHGWPERQGERSFESAHPQAAGELAAFLLRVLGDGERVEVTFTDLGRDGDAEVWYLARGSERPGLLLHAWIFDAGELEASSFWPRLRSLQALGPCKGDGERLVAWHTSADCAFLLTGRGEDVDGVAAGVRETPAPGVSESTPYDAAVEQARRGDLLGAAVRCRALAGAQPWHRDAYVLGAAVFLLLGRPVEAEELAFVAAGYLPDDPLVLHYLGLARLRQGRVRDAEAMLARAVEVAPERAATRTLWLVALLRQGRLPAALRAARLPSEARGDPEAEAHRRLVASLRGLVATTVAAVATLPLLVAAHRLGPPAWPWAVACAGFAAVVAGIACGRRLRLGMARALDDDVPRVLQRIRRGRRAARRAPALPCRAGGGD